MAESASLALDSLASGSVEPAVDRSMDAVPFSSAWYESLRDTLGTAACRQLGFYVIPEDLLLSVVMPIYNEKETLLDVIERVRAVPIRKELILVDDYSTDGTREILRELEASGQVPVSQSTGNSSSTPDSNPAESTVKPVTYEPGRTTIKVVYHPRNRGKGAAVRTGFLEAQGDIVLIQDADLEYDPNEYPRLLHPIVEDKADVVYGSRFLGDRPHRVLYYWHYLGNRFLTTLSNCFTNLNLTDMETCYKVFKRKVIADIGPKLRQERFGIEPEMTGRIARRGYRVYEMSISYSGRTYEQGKKIGWRDGLKALWCIVRYGLRD